MIRWNFLRHSLPKYLDNPYIQEIVIVDETGDDIEIIKRVYKDNPKLKLFKNDTVLGPFLNKYECLKKASCDWICLMDSDNFADSDYFENFLSFTKESPDQNVIYCPSFAKPHCDFRFMENFNISKESLKEVRGKIGADKLSKFEMFFNTGNNIFHRSVCDKLQALLSTNNEVKEISTKCHPCDVIFKNSLLLEEGYSFISVPKMYYEHRVHGGSIWVTTNVKYRDVSDYVHAKFRAL